MQLKMSLPERPGWIFVIPGFDFIALLLALVMFTGVVAKESYVEIKLPPSEFRGVRLGDENPVVVMLKSTASGPVYYVEGVKVPQASLGGGVLESAEKRGTKAVAIKVDSEATMAERQILINTIAKLNGIRIFEGYRRKDGVEKAP
ncbi:biopolymer transporter ExbD [Akkermansiaceae bacterium]|nr:biopolymer transporter ExbD [Akkermansiaceae bacterium]MDB4470064.1 biopolymer transporter ExbD [Akkermansiaceae bacterium]